MRCSPCLSGHPRRWLRLRWPCRHVSQRMLVTLAVETSCDDTSVAVLEKPEASLGSASRAILHFHRTVTAQNAQYRGIHPLNSLESHQVHLPELVQEALAHIPHAEVEDASTTSSSSRDTCRPVAPRVPDFFSVTRGPGMRSSLSAGLDFVKGLALAYQRPFVGVHHMQAHALTPRLVSALQTTSDHAECQTERDTPDFPFLTLLVSGGHTMLLYSESLSSHRLLASAVDISIGTLLDKTARNIVPPEILESSKGGNYGQMLEEFVFPRSQESRRAVDYAYEAPRPISKIFTPHRSRWGWALTPPLADSDGGSRQKELIFAFSGIRSAVTRVLGVGNSHTGADHEQRDPSAIDHEERRELGREVMRVAFEHLAGRILLSLDHIKAIYGRNVSTLVLSGGVACNCFLRHIIRAVLDAHGHSSLGISVPPTWLCTDNAAMIAWAGMEMWEAGWQSTMSCLPIRRWSLDEQDPNGNGGILGADGWQRRV